MQQLKKIALSNSLFPATQLVTALELLGFVQADPIKSPARAEELILRHRVSGYTVGELQQNYQTLSLEEDYLYAHGFMIPKVWKLLHPRTTTKLAGFHKKVFTEIAKQKRVDQNLLQAALGKKQVTNWWGGKSQAVKMALEELHYMGYIKIAGRKGSNRIYAYFEPTEHALSIEQRLAKLVLHTVQILNPVTIQTLNQALHRQRRYFGQTKPIIDRLLKEDRLSRQTADGLEYISLPTSPVNQRHEGVKFLAPFDPLIWDRQRFEHLWGWPYRFEAYTPKAKRIRGYYAMPLLWNEDIIGWANVTKQGEVDLGFVDKRPTSKQFASDLSDEVNRLRTFLKLGHAGNNSSNDR